LLSKNGQLNLFARNKPDHRNRRATYDLFDPTLTEDPYNKRGNITPRKARDMTIDNVGHYRSSHQFRSQPRNSKRQSKLQYPGNHILIRDKYNLENKEINFKKQSSKRQDRLNKFQNYFTNTSVNNSNKLFKDARNKSLSNIQIKNSIKNKKGNYSSKIKYF